MGKNWTDWKSKLYNEFVVNATENKPHPRFIYDISEETWNEFIKHRETDEFKVYNHISLFNGFVQLN